MADLKIPLPVKLICAVTYSNKIDRKSIETELNVAVAPIDLCSEEFLFHHTHYYQKEMGPDLQKYFVCFSQLFQPEMTPDIKIRTNLIEKRYSRNGKRRVNLDPGYLEKAKLVLLTTKNYSHRIYLGSGIYGDVQLIMKGGTFQPQEWTYPDYRDEKVIAFFRKVRDRYCREVDSWRKSH